jgi:hypothetical protein
MNCFSNDETIPMCCRIQWRIYPSGAMAQNSLRKILTTFFLKTAISEQIPTNRGPLTEKTFFSSLRHVFKQRKGASSNMGLDLQVPKSGPILLTQTLGLIHKNIVICYL